MMIPNVLPGRIEHAPVGQNQRIEITARIERQAGRNLAALVLRKERERILPAVFFILTSQE